jgi:hypothetical protein
MYEKELCCVYDLIDCGGVNVGVGTNNRRWCRSRTCGDLGEKRNEETSKDKDQDGTSRIH